MELYACIPFLILHIKVLMWSYAQVSLSVNFYPLILNMNYARERSTYVELCSGFIRLC